MTFESILLLLALWKTLMEARKSMIRTSSLMAVLLRDSVLYFGGVTLFTVVRQRFCCISHLGPNRYNHRLLPINRPISSLGISHRSVLE